VIDCLKPLNMSFTESSTRLSGRRQENCASFGPGFFGVLVFVELIVACFASVVYNLALLEIVC